MMKTPYTENFNIRVPSGSSAHSTFSYKDFIDPLNMFRCKDRLEKFVEYTEDKVKWLYETFPHQPTTELTDVLSIKKQKNVIFVLKRLLMLRSKVIFTLRIKKLRDDCHYAGLYGGAAYNNCNLKYRIPDHNFIASQRSSVHQGARKQGLYWSHHRKQREVY